MRGILKFALCTVMGLMTATLSRGAEAEEIALAERIAALADRYGSIATAAPYKQALYEAAARLSEKEVRFLRQRYRAAESSADIESMLETLLEWRKLEPNNLFVQMRLLDVYLSRQQTADERLNYVRKIVDTERVDAQLRSHAAVQMARLQFEQSRTQQAMESLRRALVLNGLNTDALQLQWQLAHDGSTPVQRLTILLAMLRANPASIESVLMVAEELADAGMVQPSLQWYAHAATVAQPFGGLGGAAAKNAAAMLLIAGQDRGAAGISSRLLEQDTSDPGAWFLTLMAERDVADRIELVKRNALIGLLNRLAVVRNELGVKNATTRPLGSDDQSIPDLSADPQLLKGASPELHAAYNEALADLLWLVVFHEVKADGAALINALKATGDADEQLLARLEGWSLLRAGKIEEARAALAGIADSDPLAAIAMVRVLRQDPSTATQATELARRTLRRFPSRLIGVYVHAELAPLAGEIPADPTVDLMRDVLDRFPRELLKLATAPQEFVQMRIQPHQVGHDVGEAMLVDIELRNLRDIPVVVGPSGMIRDIWIDVQSRGLLSQWASGVSFDKSDGPVLLQQGTPMRWTVRVDRGPLAQFMERSVQQALQLNVFALSNAVPTPAGVVPGPAGIRGRMLQMLERRPSNLTTDAAIRRARTTAEGADPVAKLRLIDSLAAHLQLMKDPEAGEGLKLMEAEYKDIMSRLMLDGSPVVSAWARYRAGQTGVESAERMAADLAGEKVWYARLLAAVTTMEAGPGQRANQLQSLQDAADADATVLKLVAAIPAAMATAEEGGEGQRR